ncbi:MAG: hypothetical protein GW903_01945 [Alphaproteobacteria bacterium]|nr:hypothetical protein [Alphaproteobacteria bacterium]NCT05759.1 hypothetical protein [Alphaproteobacteria bacterium]
MLIYDKASIVINIGITLPTAIYLAHMIMSDSLMGSGDTNIRLASSVGPHDNRVEVDPLNDIFDTVGRLLASGSACTFTKIDMAHFTPLNGGNVLLTAMHCLPKNDSTSISVQGEYVDDLGNEVTYQASVTEVWKHPFYNDYRQIVGAEDSLYTPYDIALLYVPAGTPLDNVEPAIFHPYNFEQSEYNNRAGMRVASVGYSADFNALAWDPDCQIEVDRYQDVISNCDITSGASGGPVADILTQASTKLNVHFVNGGASTGTDSALHSYLDERFVNTVEFVTSDRDNTLTCATVNTMTSQRRYMGPGTEYQVLRARDNFNTAAPLYPNHFVVTYGEVNIGGQSWTMTGAIDNVGATEFRMGYVPTRALVPAACP